MSDMNYTTYILKPVIVTLSCGEKVSGQLIFASDKFEYITVMAGTGEKRIARTHVAMIE